MVVVLEGNFGEERASLSSQLAEFGETR